MRQAVLGDSHPDTQLSVRQLGKSLLALGRPAEASLSAQSWRYAEAHPQNKSRTYATMSLYGAALAQQANLSAEDRAQAEQLLLDAWQALVELPAAASLRQQVTNDLRFTAEQLAAAYERWDDASQASHWKEKRKALDDES